MNAEQVHLCASRVVHNQLEESRRFNDKLHELNQAMQDEQQAQLVLQKLGLEAYENLKEWQALKRSMPFATAQYMKERFRAENNSFHDLSAWC